MASKMSVKEESKLDKLIEHVMVHYRWIFVMFLLPVSFLYDIIFYLRNWIVFKLSSAPKKHLQKVQTVQRQVKKWHEEGGTKNMCTARPGWQTISPHNQVYKSKMHQISVNLVDIIDIDSDRGFVTCEPLVTMGQLTHTLDKLGWTIPILPELDDLTVGGLVMGTGIETTSHKFGLFQHICLSYELVMSDGSVIKCSEEENSDLFFSVPWSYGTLGFLTAVKIKMIPSKRFVKLTYKPAHTAAEGDRILNEELGKGGDAHMFVESLIFDKERAVVMVGDMVDSCEVSKLNEIGKWHKEWFFKHVESFLHKGTYTEYIPLRDYYHRHSRSIFWEIQDIIPFGNNVVFRYLLGWLVPPKVSLLKLTQGKKIKQLYEEQHVIQDMLVRISDMRKCIDFFHDQVSVYPIWICPFLLPNNPGMLKTPGGGEEMFVDIGVYGVPKTASYHHVTTSRNVEKFVRDLGGFQMLYADSYLTEEEFEGMFDHTLYNEMREKYDCKKAFPRVYDKVNRRARMVAHS